VRVVKHGTDPISEGPRTNSALSSKSKDKSKSTNKDRRVQFTEVYDSRSISDMKKEREQREAGLK